MRRILAYVVGFAALVGAALALFFSWPAGLEPVTASGAQPTGAALIARGEYLATAGDCAACHTIPGGKPFAGGLVFDLPFGRLYAPNITPDSETGIGAWSDAEFVRAMRRGIDRDGHNLYPAFPYASYALVATDDLLAIRAYLATLQPAHQASPANDVIFPFNQRYFLRAWNLLFLPAHRFEADAAQSAAVNRGAYLVEALAHCEECHTPRNFLMGLDHDKRFSGEKQAGWLAYNVTSDKEHGLGAWSDEQLSHYLAFGYAKGHGPASGPMAEVVEKSLRSLTTEDISAIVAYLRTLPAQPDGPPAVGAGSPVAVDDTLGQRRFAQACAGCHLPDGNGRQSAWASLGGSHSAGDPAATNLLQVLAHGTSIGTADGTMFMHEFTGAYSDEELAALANYTSGQFGYRQGAVTSEQIKRLRTTVK
jgi:mono/diheme cytochrome c family protein